MAKKRKNPKEAFIPLSGLCFRQASGVTTQPEATLFIVPVLKFTTSKTILSHGYARFTSGKSQNPKN